MQSTLVNGGQSEKTIDIVAITILMTLQLQMATVAKQKSRKKIEFAASLLVGLNSNELYASG